MLENTKKNLIGIVGEIPYIYDPAISNSKLSKTKKRNLVEMELVGLNELLVFLKRGLSLKNINKKSLFYVVIKENSAIIKNLIKLKQEFLENLSTQKCSYAEEFSIRVVKVFYRTLIIGELRRLLLDSKQTTEVKSLVKEFEKTIERNVAFINKNSNYRVIPVKSLVEMQVTCLLEAL